MVVHQAILIVLHLHSDPPTRHKIENILGWPSPFRHRSESDPYSLRNGNRIPFDLFAIKSRYLRNGGEYHHRDISIVLPFPHQHPDQLRPLRSLYTITIQWRIPGAWMKDESDQLWIPVRRSQHHLMEWSSLQYMEGNDPASIFAYAFQTYYCASVLWQSNEMLPSGGEFREKQELITDSLAGFDQSFQFYRTIYSAETPSKVSTCRSNWRWAPEE